jgi:hypothetical protein
MKASTSHLATPATLVALTLSGLLLGACHPRAGSVRSFDDVFTASPRTTSQGHTTLDSVVCSDEPVVVGTIPEGCPIPLIRVHVDRIEVAWDIGFDAASRLDAPSTPVVDLLASVLIRDPTIRRVQVGLMQMDRNAPDTTGAYADQVLERLLERGVDKRRITVRGLGIAPEKDAEGKPIRSARPSGYRLVIQVLSRSGRTRSSADPQGDTSVTAVPEGPWQGAPPEPFEAPTP